jgi:hypothetical protein
MTAAGAVLHPDGLFSATTRSQSDQSGARVSMITVRGAVVVAIRECSARCVFRTLAAIFFSKPARGDRTRQVVNRLFADNRPPADWRNLATTGSKQAGSCAPRQRKQMQSIKPAPRPHLHREHHTAGAAHNGDRML